MTPRSCTCCGVCSLSKLTFKENSQYHTYVQGSDNTQAYTISRNQLPLFFSQVPEAKPSPRPMNPALLALLVEYQPDRTSPAWARLFKNYGLANSMLRSYKSGSTISVHLIRYQHFQLQRE